MTPRVTVVFLTGRVFFVTALSFAGKVVLELGLATARPLGVYECRGPEMGPVSSLSDHQLGPPRFFRSTPGSCRRHSEGYSVRQTHQCRGESQVEVVSVASSEGGPAKSNKYTIIQTFEYMSKKTPPPLPFPSLMFILVNDIRNLPFASPVH